MRIFRTVGLSLVALLVVTVLWSTQTLAQEAKDKCKKPPPESPSNDRRDELDPEPPKNRSSKPDPPYSAGPYGSDGLEYPFQSTPTSAGQKAWNEMRR